MRPVFTWGSARNIAEPSTPRCCCAFTFSRAMSLTTGFSNRRQPAQVQRRGSQGQHIFETTACINCHTVAGTVANGRFGPDLTHLMSRDTIASGAATEHAGKSAAMDSKSRRHQARLPDAGNGVERSRNWMR